MYHFYKVSKEFTYTPSASMGQCVPQPSTHPPPPEAVENGASRHFLQCRLVRREESEPAGLLKEVEEV
jgi:hypothetical protein